MGYAIAISPCIGCGRTFAYNPVLVPSVPVNGVKEPICQACVDAANPKRIANGLEPIRVLPGAYEPAEESQLW